MIQPLELSLSFNPFSHGHISQVLAGFELLRKKGLVKYSTCFHYDDQDPGLHSVVVKSCGKLIMYSVSDGYTNWDDDQLLSQFDFIFKRSFDAKRYHNSIFSTRIYPLGFNYRVSCNNNPFDNSGSLFGMGLKGFRLLIKNKVSTQLKFQNSRKYYHINQLNPAYSADTENREELDVLFITRLWFPYPDVISHTNIEALILKEPYLKFLYDLDQIRIRLVKAIKKKYGNRARSGLIGYKNLHKVFSDLAIDKYFTSRKIFFNAARVSKVCVISNGLCNSTGWRFGEFVALGRAIVSEELSYQVPGNFKSGLNYLSFSNVDECLEQINRLLIDGDLRAQIQKNNADYYYRYLSPDKMIETTLAKAGLLKI